MNKNLFDENFLKKLEKLKLIAQKNLRGKAEGEKGGKKRGGKLEFADHRKYTPGDDLRYIDWNVYGRSDKLFLKEFTKEEEIFISFLLDASESMKFGTKLNFAKKIATALAYIALTSHNKLQFGCFQNDDVKWKTNISGEKSILELMEFLSTIEPNGETNLDKALERFHQKNREPSLLYILSDLMMNEDTKRKFLPLTARGFQINCFHILSKEELSPKLAGKLTIRDSEYDKKKDVFITETTIKEYKKQINKFCESWQKFCVKHRMNYIMIPTYSPIDEVILLFLRKRGILT